jgi:glycosyltransferase involved in cell wall biosynthesis
MNGTGAMPNKVKVLYVIERLARAGTELHLLKLLTHLDRDRFEPVLCCLSAESTDRSLLPSDMPSRLLDGRWNLLRPATIRLFFRLRRLIAEERPDILHSFLFVSNVMAPFAASRRHVRGILISRGRMGIEWRANFAHRFLQRRADRRADLITCKTEAMRFEIARVERVALDKIQVVPNGVDLDRFRFQAGALRESREFLEREFGVSVEGPLILAVGNLKPIKGHIHLARAAAEFLKRAPRAQFAIVGDGESREGLRNEIKTLKLDRSVHLPGSLEDVRPWLRGADLFTAPSLSEGLPNALLEAMAMGLPCVLSRIPGHLEVAGSAAWYFEPGNPESLAVALGEAFHSPQLRAERGRALLERVRAEYSVEAMCRRVEAVYDKILSKGQSRSV